MKKVPALFFILFLCPLIAGAYGIVHDQFTYTISPEYYTKFKFISFGIDEEYHNRIGVGIVGFKAAWWTGIPVGLIIGSVGLIHETPRVMMKVSLQSIAIVLVITLITGFAGLAYGKFFLASHPKEYFSEWFVTENITDLPAFISTGSMHNFSYVGGAIGLLAGAGWQWRMKRMYKLGAGEKTIL